jgi:hypothetical protein
MRLDDVRDRAAGELGEVALDESLVAAPDAGDGDALGERGTDHGADGGVHAGGVAAAGQDSDAFNPGNRRAPVGE